MDFLLISWGGMRSFLNLFGPSPFKALQVHMQIVARCVHMLVELFEALEQKDYDLAKQVATAIERLEHQADIAKNDIRNHLPKSLFIPIDRNNLLSILSIQDNIADSAEDVAVLTSFKKIEIPANLKMPFDAFLKRNLEAFDAVRQIIEEMGELVEFSFGGLEAEKVKNLVNEVAIKEHEVDLLQHSLLRALFAMEAEISYGTFYLWMQLITAIASLSNLSQNMADRVRMTLESD